MCVKSKEEKFKRNMEFCHSLQVSPGLLVGIEDTGTRCKPPTSPNNSKVLPQASVHLLDENKQYSINTDDCLERL